MSKPLDDVDRKIIRLLRANARASQEQIAKSVHLSRPAVHERIKHLEKTGVVRGYQALVNWDGVGLAMTCFIWVRLRPTHGSNIGTQMANLTSDMATVEECHRVTGEWSMLLKVRAASPQALQTLIDRLYKIPGVQNTLTTVVLSTLLEDGVAAD